MSVAVAIVVPYRPARLQNREHHLTAFLQHMPAVLNEAIGENKWAICIIQQSQDGQKFSRARCLNAGARIIEAKYPGAVLVLHDVDLLPDVPRARGYILSPPPLGILSLNSDSAKYGESEQYVGGICVVGQDTFKRVNGFQNTFQGWGGEDDCFRDAVKALHPPRCPISMWLAKYVEGRVTDLEETDGTDFSRACNIPEARCDKTTRRQLRDDARARGYPDGAKQLVFEVSSQKLFPDISPNVSLYTVNLFVTLNAGWCMGMSTSRHLPYYYRLLTGESTYELPGTRLLAASTAPSLKRPRSDSNTNKASLSAFCE